MKRFVVIVFSVFIFMGLVFNPAFAQKKPIKKPVGKITKTQPVKLSKKKIAIADNFIDFKITPQNIYRVNHLRVLVTPGDHPVVHPFLDLYQEDRRFSDLFSSSGQSMICGPTALANVLIYLKANHNPKYTKILKDHENELRTNEDYIRFLFDTCQTDKDDGTYIDDLEAGAKNAIVEGGYAVGNVFIIGVDGALDTTKRPVGPDDLRLFSSSTPDTDRGVVLLFGWYRQEQENGRKVYKRKGGHYVVLAGYDSAKPHTFYVTNPLVSYADLGQERYSKITLKRLSWNQTPINNVEYYTEDLVGGHFAILEDILVVLPR